MEPHFEPGTRILRREVLHQQLWMQHPVTVVADDGDVLAVLLEPGSRFDFRDHPIGPHPWGAHEEWGASIVLQLMRAGDRYAVWKSFGPDGAFRHWYVNFEAPIVRHDDSFDTDDHGLDLIVHPDGRREWKDVEDLNAQLTQGRITLETIGGVLAAAEAVVDLLDSDDRWWAPWDDWTPA